MVRLYDEIADELLRSEYRVLLNAAEREQEAVLFWPGRAPVSGYAGIGADCRAMNRSIQEIGLFLRMLDQLVEISSSRVNRRCSALAVLAVSPRSEYLVAICAGRVGDEPPILVVKQELYSEIPPDYQ